MPQSHMVQNYTAPTKTGVHKSWFFIPVFRFLPPVTPYFNKIRYFCAKRKSPALMDQVIKLNAVEQYNKLYGLETRHPLVSVVNLNQARRNPEHFQVNYGLYALFLKDAHCGDILYGRQRYDYQDGTIVSFAPGQIVEVNRNAGPVSLDVHGLLFHPDLIRGTALGHDIKNYTFFSYEAREALHISEAERKIVLDCLDKIDTELRQGADRHSQRLITANINLLLDYCMRFYDRQFATRQVADQNVLARFEHLLDEYFESGLSMRQGLPTVKYFADKVCLSANYFGDMFSKLTGQTASEYIQHKLIDRAKQQLLYSPKTMSEIAYELGFQYPQHLSRMFKRLTGTTPNAFRNHR